MAQHFSLWWCTTTLNLVIKGRLVQKILSGQNPHSYPKIDPSPMFYWRYKDYTWRIFGFSCKSISFIHKAAILLQSYTFWMKKKEEKAGGQYNCKSPIYLVNSRWNSNSQNSEELKKKNVLVCNCFHVINWFRLQGRWCCQKDAKGTSSQTRNKILLHIRKSSFFVSYTSTADGCWTDALAEILTETSSECTSNDDQVVQLTLFSMYSVMYKGKK